MTRPRPTVLVVDDDSATREDFNGPTAKLGVYLPCGRRRRPACQVPHAIVTDLLMPGMTGLEFIASLGERVRQIAVIFVTGQATVDTAVQAIKLGAYDYVPKPLELERLRTLLEKV